MRKLTPMMQQYMEIKARHQDSILFFRLGDFYEMFMEDAIVASKELDIALTGRDGGLEDRIPMCGVPFHAAEGYIAKLIEKGFKVAICEQVEDPKEVKGIVKRDVVKIITPGTVLDSRLLQEKSYNYLLVLTEEKSHWGIALCDISTGLFQAYELNVSGNPHILISELQRLNPAEILIKNSSYPVFSEICQGYSNCTISPYPDSSFKLDLCKELLCGHFQTNNLDALGYKDIPLGILAAGALLDFLMTTQKGSLPHLTKLEIYQREDYMLLDWSTRRNLELTSTLRDGAKKNSLLWVLDDTKTAMGGRLLRSWIDQPLVNKTLIDFRLDAVSELIDLSGNRESLKTELAKIYDLERLISRISCGGANPRDLVALQKSLNHLPEIAKLLADSSCSLLKKLYSDLDTLADICSLLLSSIREDAPNNLKETGIIKEGFSPEIDSLRENSGQAKGWLTSLEYDEKQKTGIKSLKVGFNKVFGYYIEVTKSNVALVPEYYERKQTLANAERYVTPRLKEIEGLILGAEDRLVDLEYEAFVAIRQQVMQHITRIQKTAQTLAQLDALLSLATVSLKFNYVRPEVNNQGSIEITEGRHPVIEALMGSEQFIANDVCLDLEDNRFLLITGPNMAGKSTYMRQVALIVLMAQIGSFVPASSAKIGITDRIFTRVGASDDLATGQSTFMVEMNEVAFILNNATYKSLIIMDEIGRGTSTFDGLSIAYAVAEYIIDRTNLGAKTLFATHYHELIKLEKLHQGVMNYSIAVKEQGEKIVFLRKIIPGGTDKSYGIQVARLAGLPEKVLTRAKSILTELEADKLEAEKHTGITESQNVQFELFASPPKETPIIKELQELNILNLTPLQALTELHRLQELLKK